MLNIFKKEDSFTNQAYLIKFNFHKLHDLRNPRFATVWFSKLHLESCQSISLELHSINCNFWWLHQEEQSIHLFKPLLQFFLLEDEAFCSLQIWYLYPKEVDTWCSFQECGLSHGSSLFLWISVSDHLCKSLY